jgi:hypothetical protein
VVAVPLRALAAYFATRVRKLALELSGASIRMVDALVAADDASSGNSR